MKKIYLLLLIPFLVGAAPSRVSTYVTGTTIESVAVTGNEDAIFNYLQQGVEVIKDGTILDPDINVAAAIVASKLDLTPVTQNITHTGVLTQTGTAAFTSASFTAITDLGAVTTTGTITTGGKVTAAANEIEGSNFDVNGGAIDGTAIGANSETTGKFTTVESTQTTGTAPFTVASTTKVTNLNADLLDGLTSGDTGFKPFGSYTSGVVNSATQAATDLLLFVTVSADAGASEQMNIKIDSNSTPTTSRLNKSGWEADDLPSFYTFAVKKDEYYFIDTSNGSNLTVSALTVAMGS